MRGGAVLGFVVGAALATVPACSCPPIGLGELTVRATNRPELDGATVLVEWDVVDLTYERDGKRWRVRYDPTPVGLEWTWGDSGR